MNERRDACATRKLDTLITLTKLDVSHNSHKKNETNVKTVTGADAMPQEDDTHKHLNYDRYVSRLPLRFFRWYQSANGSVYYRYL